MSPAKKAGARQRAPSDVPWRTKVADERLYQDLDVGIRFAVRVLHARGIETCQSCQGGADPKRPDRGHAYDVPTVDLVASDDDALGFGALAALRDFGLPVRDIAIVWPIKHGLPYEKLWRITFRKTMEDRADEQPNFVYGVKALWPMSRLRESPAEKHHQSNHSLEHGAADGTDGHSNSRRREHLDAGRRGARRGVADDGERHVSGDHPCGPAHRRAAGAEFGKGHTRPRAKRSRVVPPPIDR